MDSMAGPSAASGSGSGAAPMRAVHFDDDDDDDALNNQGPAPAKPPAQHTKGAAKPQQKEGKSKQAQGGKQASQSQGQAKARQAKGQGDAGAAHPSNASKDGGGAMQGRGQGKGKGKASAGDSAKLLAEPPIPRTAPNAEIFSTLHAMLSSAAALTVEAFMMRGGEPAGGGGGSSGTDGGDSGARAGAGADVEPADGAPSTSHDHAADAGAQLALLARKRIGEMKALARKSVLSLDPSLKRMICKRCDALLLPGVSARVRVRPSRAHGQVVQTECTGCGFRRRIPAPPLAPPGEGAGAHADAQMPTAQAQEAQGQPGPSRLPLQAPLNANAAAPAPPVPPTPTASEPAVEKATPAAVEPVPDPAVIGDESREHAEAMDVDLLPAAGGSVPESTVPAAQPQPSGNSRIPQRQRRKAGNLSRLVARRLREEASVAAAIAELEAEASADALGARLALPERQPRSGKRKRATQHQRDSQPSLLDVALRTPGKRQPGPLPEVLQRGVERARRALLPSSARPKEKKRKAAPAAEGADAAACAQPAASSAGAKARSNEHLLRERYGAHGRAAGPTRNERHKIAAIERAAGKQRATSAADPSATVRLPPFYERVKGSGWHSTLSDEALGIGPGAGTPGKQHLSREEIAARKFGGGHVVLTG